jgi:hypothetical protein
MTRAQRLAVEGSAGRADSPSARKTIVGLAERHKQGMLGIAARARFRVRGASEDLAALISSDSDV